MNSEQTKTIGGVEWSVTQLGRRGVSFSAEMTEAAFAERSELWDLAKGKGWAVDPVRHEDDADIVDPGSVFVVMRAPDEV